jgi:hypothetical protein
VNTEEGVREKRREKRARVTTLMTRASTPLRGGQAPDQAVLKLMASGATEEDAQAAVNALIDPEYGDVLLQLHTVNECTDLCLVPDSRCVEALAGLHIQSVTNPCGTDGWSDRFANQLTGRHVWILPSMDLAGAIWLKAVADSFHTRDIHYHIGPIPKPFHDVAALIDAQVSLKHAVCAVTRILCEAERGNVTVPTAVAA